MSVQALKIAQQQIDELAKLLCKKDDKDLQNAVSLLYQVDQRKEGRPPIERSFDIFQLKKTLQELRRRDVPIPEFGMTQKIPEQPLFPLPKVVTEPFAMKEDKKIFLASGAYEFESKVEDVEGDIGPGTLLTMTKDNVLRPAKEGDFVVGLAMSSPSKEGRVQALLRDAYDNEPEDLRRLTFVPPPEKYAVTQPWTTQYEPLSENPRGWAKQRESVFIDRIMPKILVDNPTPIWTAPAPLPPPLPPPRPSTKIAWSIYDLRQQQADPARWKQRTADIFGILEQVLTRQLGRPVSITECNGTVNFAVPLQVSVRLISPIVCTLAITEEMTQDGETRYTAKTYSQKGISDDTEIAEISEAQAVDPLSRFTNPALGELAPTTEDAERKRNETVPPKPKTNDLEVNEREITL